MNDIFKENSKCIKFYLATETITDPYEHTKELTYLNPISIKGLVQDLTFAQVQWKMPGIITDKAKEIIIEKKYRPILELSYKIKVDGDNDYYNGWKVNSKMQIREEGEYIRCYIYVKKES